MISVLEKRMPTPHLLPSGSTLPTQTDLIQFIHSLFIVYYLLFISNFFIIY